MTPLVSVVLCTYNRTDFLADALESIFSQTYPEIEVIVVDDASTNPALFHMLDGYGDRIRLIRRKSNSQTCELPRYQGVRQAKGSYCAFLDSDDMWAPDKIAKQVAFLEAHPEVPLCHTYCSLIDEEGHTLGVRHEGAISPTGRCGSELLDHCYISISSVVVRPAVWLQAVQEKNITSFGMDWDFFMAIAKKHDIGFLNEPLGCYRLSSQSVTQSNWKRTPRNVMAMERLRRNESWVGIGTKREMLTAMTNAYLENADAHRYWGHPWRSAYFCLRGIRSCPWSVAIYIALLKACVRAVVRVKPLGETEGQQEVK